MLMLGPCTSLTWPADLMSMLAHFLGHGAKAAPADAHDAGREKPHVFQATK